MWRACLLVLFLASGCKERSTFADAGPRDDAAPSDASAAIDAAPPAPGRELTSGSGRMTSPSYVVDVQVGHSTPQEPIRATGVTIEGNAPVKP